MAKFIVYQGAEEKYRWRQVDDEGNFLAQADLLDTPQEAIDAVNALSPDAEIDDRTVEDEE